ncbi:hypothetical protein BJY00DRAFT_310409 [Aspergillus carlsbadensis]|nr:hypothetical protein BJY00DRAFT_310409 [Aspergillus carlsbadensis]
MPDLIGTGLAVTPEGFLKEAHGIVKQTIVFPIFITVRPRDDTDDRAQAYPLDWREFKPEPCGVPNVGDAMMGYWISGGVVHWSPGKVDKVEQNKEFVIVEKGEMETFWGRDSKNGTAPSIKFQ